MADARDVVNDGFAALDARIPTVELINAASLQPEPIQWLWTGWLARGKLHVLAGAPGTGKTTVAMDWAATISAGKLFPSGARAPRGKVLIWSGEDDPADTLLPRLIAAGADLSNIQFVGDVRQDGMRAPFDPSRDVETLAKAATSDIALIVVDPLVSAVAGDSHKNAEVRRSLAPLVDLAASLNAALLGITHYSKGTQGRDPLERVSGSLAFGALARIVFGTVQMKSDDDDAPRRLTLARAKSNIGPDGGGFVYAFEQVSLPDHDGIEASRIRWGESLEGSARELLAESEPESEGGQDAASFLRDLLADGHLAAKAIYREAQGAGFSPDQMKRAKRRIGAEAIKEGYGGAWVWRLPPCEGSAEGCEGSTQKRPLSSLPSEPEPLPSGGVGPDDGSDLEVTL